jgi:hypothetical protein
MKQYQAVSLFLAVALLGAAPRLSWAPKILEKSARQSSTDMLRAESREFRADPKDRRQSPSVSRRL